MTHETYNLAGPVVDHATVIDVLCAQKNVVVIGMTGTGKTTILAREAIKRIEAMRGLTRPIKTDSTHAWYRRFARSQ